MMYPFLNFRRSIDARMTLEVPCVALNQSKMCPKCAMAVYFNQKFYNLSLLFIGDEDRVAGSVPLTKLEATGDTQSTSSKLEDGGDEEEEITEFFSYDCLKSNSIDPAPKINIKRKEVYAKLRSIGEP